MMVRHLKASCVAVLALALCPLAASAAPKLTPVPEEYPVTLKGSQVGTNVFELEGGRRVECTNATFEGTVANKAEAEESKLTAKPTYSGCTATVLGNKELATFTMNGCDFDLTGVETTSGTIASEGWEVTGSVHVTCPAGKVMELHLFTTEQKDIENRPRCTYAIGPQTPSGSLDYKLNEQDASGNGTSGEINSTITDVTTIMTSGTETSCGAPSQNGKLSGRVKVEGFNAGGTMLRGKVED